MTKSHYDKVKVSITNQGVPFKWFVHNSWCILNIDKAPITIDMLDDLYYGLVSRVMYKLSTGKTHKIAKDQYTKATYNKVFDELSYFVSETIPIDVWELKFPETMWPDIIEQHIEWEQEDPESRMIKLRSILSNRHTKKPKYD